MDLTIKNALSSMNYLFLKKVFRNDDFLNLSDEYLSIVLNEELALFLNSLSKETWSNEFKEIVKNELSEGTYLESLDFNTIKNKFTEAIKDLFIEEDNVLLEKYLAIVADILEI